MRITAKPWIVFVVLAVLILAVQLVYAGILGPSSYEECIEEVLKGVSSDVAARALIANCRKKFPAAKPETAAPDIKSRISLYQSSPYLQDKYKSQDKFLEACGITESSVRLDYDTIPSLKKLYPTYEDYAASLGLSHKQKN